MIASNQGNLARFEFMKEAKFDIGHIVRHTDSGLRGVIVDVDPEFNDRELQVEEGGDIPHRSSPWYHVLLDDQELQAYIAERQLQRDYLGQPINHAYIEVFFSNFDTDHYVSRRSIN